MLEETFTVAFLPNTSNKVVAEANTCFKVLKIPSYQSDYNDFLKYMDISISYGLGLGRCRPFQNLTIFIKSKPGLFFQLKAPPTFLFSPHKNCRTLANISFLYSVSRCSSFVYVLGV